MNNKADPSAQSSNDGKLFSFTKPPVLLIGSGMSKRYLLGYKSWSELLLAVSERFSISPRRFRAFLTAVNDDPGEFGAYPHLASKLKTILSDGLMSGEYDADAVFTRPGEIELYDQGVDFLKILVSSETNSYSVIDSEPMLLELTELRKLSAVIPSAITTNYDCFLEKEVFRDFAVYSSISDYYFSDSQGIGEIYKVHGSVDDPRSLVVSDEDYRFLRENSKIVTAKILSLLCDYPMVILGNSLSDPDITEILHDLMTSLDADRLKEVGGNIVYIAYDESASEPVFGEKTIEYHNQKMTVPSIRLNSFKGVYEEIGRMTPSTTPSNVRKLRQLVKRVVLTTEPTDNQFITLGIDDLDSKDSRNISLIVADKDVGDYVKTYSILTARALIDDVVNHDASINENSVLRFFITYPHYNDTMYLPLFPYIRRCRTEEVLNAKKIRGYIDTKKTQFSTKIQTILDHGSRGTCDASNPFEGIKAYMKPRVILYLFCSGRISKQKAMNLLRDVFNEFETGNQNFDTNYKLAVTYVSSIEEERVEAPSRPQLGDGARDIPPSTRIPPHDDKRWGADNTSRKKGTQE